ncbi:MAG: T9SS C-terminal target domain-containing protein [Bacteroidetes bacterium]|nr:MAG: T9SS C-terminal target domain-containing protein [Bacteroidota bacterium]
MKNIIHITTVLLLVCWGIIPALAQTDPVETVCNPTENLPVASGDVVFNYGSATNVFSSRNRSDFTIAQPVVGESVSQRNIGQFGFWSRFLLPPQAPMVLTSQGDFPDRVQINWSMDPLSAAATGGFTILRDGAYLAEVDVDISQYIDFNVQAGEIYEYTVYGANQFGSGMRGSALGFVNPNGAVSGRVLTPSGTPVVDATVSLSPISGSALQLDGEGDYLCIDHKSVLPSDTWTLSAWVKIGDTYDSDAIIDLGSDLNKNFWLFTTPSGQGKGVVIGVGNGTSAETVSHVFTENADEWHYVTAVFGGGQLILYIDGDYVKSMAATISQQDARFTMGARRDQSGGFYDGKLDDVRIYSRMLTQTEIMLSKDITPSSSTPGLVAYWKFDEGTGSKTFDLSGNEMTARIFGATFDNEDYPPIRNGALTDASGFYTIEGINYSENQTFIARPAKDFYDSYALEFNAAQESKATLTSFDLPDTATIELALLPFDQQSAQTILHKASAGGTDFSLAINAGNYELTVNGETQTVGAIPADYHHLALTLNSGTNEVQAYLDGSTFGTALNYTNLASNWDDNAWCAGAAGSSNHYSGLIDEIAIFDTLLTQAQIQVHASTIGDPQEVGVDPGDGNLFVYFPFNESKGTVVRDIGPAMSGDGSLVNATFSINTLRPNTRPHEFTPAQRQVNVNASNTAVSQIDFTDNSTIKVSGVVRFANTFCYQKEIEILVNGASYNPPIMTDAEGRWVGEFGPGEDLRFEPSFEDHTFIPAFFEVEDLQTPVAGVLFQNTTKRTLQGVVRGGECSLPVINEDTGDRVIFELRSDNGCLVLRDTVTTSDGKYEFRNIPPIEYSIGVAAGSSSAIFDFFEPQGGSPVDLRMVERDTIDFDYFSTPQIEIMGLDNYACEGGDMLSHPILIAGVKYRVDVRVYEPYLDERCYLDSAVVQVTNNIEETPQVQRAISGSTLRLNFRAGMPNFIAPYLKSLDVSMETEDGRTANAGVSAAILGAQRLPGAILPTSPPIYPFYILRDPPGDGSVATLEQSKKVCRTYGINTTFKTDAGVDVEVGSNATLFGVKLAGKKLRANYDYSFSEEKGRETMLCVSTTETISTPESDEFVGSDGDTYIGAALNITYGANRELFIDENTCQLSVKEEDSMELEGFATEFIFTEKHIKDVVIPQALEVGDSATAERWTQLIERNQLLKDEAQEPVLSIKVNEGNVPTTPGNLLTLTDRDGDGIDDDDDECPWWTVNQPDGSPQGRPTNCYRDFDRDNVERSSDNCPTDHNPFQQDSDGDGMGDACDDDDDNDDIPDATDNCPFTPNPDQADSNNDGIGDVCQTDFDNDGIVDSADRCPETPSAGNADDDGDFIGNQCELDTDQDGIPDDRDPCPFQTGEDCDTDTELDSELTLGDVRKNITFGAGISYESSWAQDSVLTVSESETDDHTAGMEIEVNFGDEAMGALFGSVTGKVGFNWGHGEYESNNLENSTTVGFTLTDDDVGDFYTVDILSDPRYKTPVFKVRGGDSSCPYEGGDLFDEQGEPILRNRDQVNFSVDIPENSITNVGENDKAVVFLNVGNDSPAGQPRTYTVAPVQESNPDGAIIKIAGSTRPRVVTIPAGEQLRLVTTIEKGPVAFEYDSLRIAMYAECEFNAIDIINGDIDPRFYKEVAFDVQFVEGCPGVDITSPLEGWVVNDPNPETAKLEIQLSNYEETNPQLEEIRTQYRLVGGSGVWINIDTIPRAELGPVDTRTNWFVGDLSDGQYEIRAVSFCNSGLAPGSSEFVQGQLERKAPELFGSTEPADGVLSPGDEISITFNEPIRCNEIFQADGIGTNINFNNLALLDLTTGDLIDAIISCDGQKITIVPAVQNRFIENHTLRVITNDIKDLVGNESEEIAWEFFVNRSNLYWEGGPINEMIQEGTTAIVTREIRNQSGETSEFTLSGIPSWMSVFPQTGSLAPGGRVVVNFEFPADLLVDTYETTVIMETADGDEPLDVKLRVNCEGPDWSFDASQYSFSMNLTVELDIEGVISTDEVDRIAAFVGTELRGLAYVEYAEELDRYLAFLTVYSNAASGETVDFQIWDADICTLYGNTLESFPFEPDGLIGEPLSPQTIHTSGLILKKIYINPGWNWISYNLELQDPDINAALSSLTNPSTGLIKDQTTFANYSDNLGIWGGSLTDLTHLTMYQYRSGAYDSLLLVGMPVDPSTPMPITTGWNWIGFLPQQGLPVDEALASLTPLNGDIVKGQFTFAQYVAGIGWIGNLNFMTSPKGYQLRISNPGTLVYPAAASGNLVGDSPQVAFKNRQLEDEPVFSHWEVNPGDFEYSMNFIGIVRDGDHLNFLADGDEVAAFVNGEVRGSSEVIYVPELDAHLIFLTVYANREGERLTFKLFDASKEQELDLQETSSFLINAIMGTVDEPMVWSLLATDVAKVTADGVHFEAFPNPARELVYLRFGAKKNEDVTIIVTDALGREVQRLETNALATENTLEWRPKVPSGLYFVTLYRAEAIQTLRLEIKR